MGYNKTFELSIDDLELIETALRDKQRALSAIKLGVADGDAPLAPTSASGDLDETLRDTHDLLGRLHNQKNFFRPKAGAYIGG